MTKVANVSTNWPRLRAYSTVLEMLADGWKLLGPPTDEPWTNEYGTVIPQREWWLTRGTK
jgi:hypothetical protein